MTQKALTLMSIDWDTFSTDLLHMLATYLQPEKANTKEKDHVADAVAPSFKDRHKRQPFSRELRLEAHGRAVRVATKVTISTCATNHPNPAKMILLAKEAAAAKRQDKLHPKGKRKRIQEANIQLSNNKSSGREDQLVKAGRFHRQSSYCWTCKTPPAGRLARECQVDW